MSDWAIETRGLSRHFGGIAAVDQLDLCIPAGCIYGFLGPNGSGKSTTLRMLTGLLTPTGGDAKVLGLTIPQAAEALRLRMGYMTQKFSLYSDLSVEENLRFLARIYTLPKAEARLRIEAQLSEYGIAKYRKRLAAKLSGGERQRLALAAATLHGPELLFLDEPTSAVDPENRRDFWEKLFDLGDRGTTILVSTHYMDEAERCHQLAILDAGRKCADASPQALMENLGARVVEIHGPELRRVKTHALALPQVRSVAQQGTQLRVLVDASVAEPEHWLRQTLPELMQGREIALVRPSLEDVFVQVTGTKPGASAS